MRKRKEKGWGKKKRKGNGKKGKVRRTGRKEVDNPDIQFITRFVSVKDGTTSNI